MRLLVVCGFTVLPSATAALVISLLKFLVLAVLLWRRCSPCSICSKNGTSAATVEYTCPLALVLILPLKRQATLEQAA
ncbi:hypothetical protein PF005_g10773 [Phytophthora fragariae]|uniref:Uncharacterized protein n=1 Tax=Phytophthora fragariae TaxID=53985 RepID=A0A6A4A1Y9_9STRA|nr:hypothetical protein PF010_g6118 [Phytophthora fragariae]KAE9212032.1 hypothetical protein PF005_g10773 [Phytophthora fragariae]KAE9246081.1 hypothetical protein PF002_g6914 [Phytophthora fragariae]